MKQSVLNSFLLVTMVPFLAGASEEPDLDFDRLRLLPVQDQGRVKPLDTLARATCRSLTGRERFVAQLPDAGTVLAPAGDPVDTFLSMAFQHMAWENAPAIKVANAALKQAAGLDPSRKHFSPAELRANSAIRRLAIEGHTKKQKDDKAKLSEPESKAMDVMAQLNTFDWLAEIDALLLVPPHTVADRYEEAHWSSPAEEVALGSEYAQPLAAAIAELRSAYLARDPARFAQTSAAFADQLRSIAPENVPSPSALAREVHYNRFKPFHVAAGLYFLAFVAWLAALGTGHRLATATAWAILVAGLAVHSYGFLLRIVISGRAPVSNMYESLVFLAWGMIVIAVVFEAIHRSHFFGLSASVVSGVLLYMAHVLPIDSGIGVLVPVLRSNYWLIVHVLTIMMSYSAFAVAWALGHVMLIQVLVDPRNVARIGPTCRFVYNVLKVGVLLIAAGTILGGVWANASWGRWWGWDPKETWALICLLGYLAVLHARYTNWIGLFGLAVWSVLAFMLVVMCYYGVNFILPVGLHSYGAGSGGVRYAMVYVVLDSLFVGAAVLRWYLAGRPRVPVDSAALRTPYSRADVATAES